MSMDVPTVAIIGGTGKTGKWALKGAVVRGYKVRILTRSSEKVRAVLHELFPSKSSQDLLKLEISVVQGCVMDEAALAQLFTGADVIMSFLGMMNPPDPVVTPGVKAIMKAMKQMEEPPRLLSMSSICINDNGEQGREAWKRFFKVFVQKRMGKARFQDLAAAEEWITGNRGQLDVTIMRAMLLSDKKDYHKDYLIRNPNYSVLQAEMHMGRTYHIDRQHVAEAFLDQCKKSKLPYRGKMSIIERKTIASE